MHVRAYMELLQVRERQLADALLALADDHAGEIGLASICPMLADWSQRHAQVLDGFIACYAEREPAEPVALLAIVEEPHGGTYGLVHDLHALWLLAEDACQRWRVLGQVAQALRDRPLLAACGELGAEAERQAAWLRTRLAEVAPQGLIASP